MKLFFVLNCVPHFTLVNISSASSYWKSILLNFIWHKLTVFLFILQQNFILLIFQSLHSLCPAHFSLVDILFTRFKWKFELYIIHFDLNQLVRYFQNYFLLNYSLWKSTQRKAMEFSLTNILVGGLTSTKYVLLE